MPLNSIYSLCRAQVNSENGTLLKVSENQNGFMKTSFLPKNNAIILRISANVFCPVSVRASILKIIALLFGRNDVFIKSL